MKLELVALFREWQERAIGLRLEALLESRSLTPFSVVMSCERRAMLMVFLLVTDVAAALKFRKSLILMECSLISVVASALKCSKSAVVRLCTSARKISASRN